MFSCILVLRTMCQGYPRPFPGLMIRYEDSQDSAYRHIHSYDLLIAKGYKAKSAKGESA